MGDLLTAVFSFVFDSPELCVWLLLLSRLHPLRHFRAEHYIFELIAIVFRRVEKLAKISFIPLVVLRNFRKVFVDSVVFSNVAIENNQGPLTKKRG